MRAIAWGAVGVLLLAAMTVASPTAEAHVCGTEAQPMPLNSCGSCTGGDHSHYEVTGTSKSTCASSADSTPFPAAPLVVTLLAVLALVRARRG